MKLAISADGTTWDARVDERFGRARHFVIASVDGSETSLTSVENKQNLQAAQGAGIQAAETVARQGVTVLLTGHVGPKAFRALSAAGIDVYTGVKGTIKDALDDYAAGKLTLSKSADVEGHW